MRQLSETEIKIATQFEGEMRSMGLIVDEDPDATQNADLILAQFANQVITVEGLRNSVKVLRPQLKWKSVAQMEYDSEYSKLNKTQQDAFGSWWFLPSTRRTIVIDGDDGFSNGAALLKWAHGRTFNENTFNLAVSNLVSSRGLHLAQESREQVSSGRPGHVDDGTPMFSKSETNLSPSDHAARAREASAKASGRREPTPATDYRSECERIVGRNHAHTEQLKKMYVTGSTGSVNWEQTYAARRRAAGL